MNRKQKLSQRVLALVLASATLFTSALPAFAMDDLSGMDTLPDIVDVDGEILDIGGVDFVVTPNESIEPDAEDSAAEPQEPELAGPPAAEQDTPLEEEAKEPFLVEDREETVNEPESEKSSGLDPPEDFSFAAQLEGGSASGIRRERASSGSTTIYIQTDSSIRSQDWAILPSTNTTARPTCRWRAQSSRLNRRTISTMLGKSPTAGKWW